MYMSISCLFTRLLSPTTSSVAMFLPLYIRLCHYHSSAPVNPLFIRCALYSISACNTTCRGYLDLSPVFYLPRFDKLLFSLPTVTHAHYIASYLPTSDRKNTSTPRLHSRPYIHVQLHPRSSIGPMHVHVHIAVTPLLFPLYRQLSGKSNHHFFLSLHSEMDTKGLNTSWYHQCIIDSNPFRGNWSWSFGFSLVVVTVL